MKSVVHSVFVLALVASSSVYAQQNYVITSISQPYSPLVGATSVLPMMVNAGSLTLKDEGFALLPLGFTFPFYGGTYTEVGINSNGVLIFGATDQAHCNYSSGNIILCTSGGTIPSTSRTPHNFIAGWWTDSEGNANGDIRYVKPSSSEIIIEFHDWGNYSASSGDSYSLQIRLNASGLFQIHYGSAIGTFSGTAGFENSNGTQGSHILPCGSSCSNTDWPTNTLFTIGQPVQADLIVQDVNLSNMVKTGSDLTFTVTPTFRNFGQTDAPNFHWKAYLSTDKFLDAADQLVYDSTVSGATVSCPGVTTNPTNPTATASGNASATNVATGNYYVLVEADTTDTVPEFSESNNTGSTLNYFTFGFDLVAVSASGPLSTGPGNNVTVTYSWFNQGTDPAPTPNNEVEFQILLSTDKVFDGNDFVAWTFTDQVTGGETCSNCTITFPLATNVPGGDYYWGVRVNSNGAAAEASSTNNVAFANTLTKVFQADLEIVSVDLLDPLTLQPTRVAYMTETARVTVTANNIGGADAKNWHIGILLSLDSNPSLLNDFLVHEEPVAILPAGQGATYDIEFTVPTQDQAGNPIKPGNYFVLAVLDSYTIVTELSEYNNGRAVGTPSAQPVQVREPASDYAVIRVETPSTGAVGELMPLYRVFRNAGNLDGQQVTYRYYASANEIVSPSDVALPMVGPNGQLVDSADLTLAVDQTDSATDLVRLPPTLVPGNWYIGVIVDVANVEPELDETNNAVASVAPLQVVPSTMAIANQYLPDGLVGAPYAYKLSTTGGGTGVTWRHEDELPAGLTLTPEGVITGTPSASSITAFTVYAESGTRAAAARLVIRVLPPTGELSVTSTSLPPVINSPTEPYAAQLSAAGGKMPYTWSLLSGALPNGLSLEKDGRIEGTPRSGVAVGEVPLLVEVMDALGNRAQGQLKLRVVEPGALLITTLSLPDTSVNTDYIADFAARNADQTPLAKPLTWSIISGRLPEGMALTTAQQELGLVTGKPLEGGTFAFSLQVQDAKGRVDVADYVLRVHPARLKLSAVNPPAVLHPGDEVNFQITTGSAQSTYRLFSGALPPGLTLDEKGTVSGTVELENALGTWNYVVEAESPLEGSTLGAFSLEVVPAPVSTSCAAAPGEGGFGLAALLAPLAALVWRRRRALASAMALVGVAVLALPGVANAQYTPIGPFAHAYQDLAGGTAVSATGTTAQSVPIKFKFKFYGQEFENVYIAEDGLLLFNTATSSATNQPIPHNASSTPNFGIAPWWDALSRNTSSPQTVIKYNTIGAAPNRVFIAEWANICTSTSCPSTAKFSFQVHLMEGSNRIRLAYKTLPAGASFSSSASVGIMGGPNIGVAGLTCGSSCSQAHWPGNSAIDFALPPELKVVAVSADDTAYVNVPTSMSAVITNTGGLDANGVTVGFYLSEDAVFDTNDVRIGSSAPMTIKMGETQTVTAMASVPVGTPHSEDYFLLVRVDPVPSEDPSDNLAPPQVLRVGPPTPDLEISAISIPANTVVGSGGTLSISGSAYNSGNAPAQASFTVSYFVSDNSVVTISDTVVGTKSMGALAERTSGDLSHTVTLPAGLKAGKYWVGACVDYEENVPEAVEEISEVNNCATGNSFVLNTGALTVVTTALPDATQNSPYGLRLEAVGGDGTYQWSIVSGELPPGITLEEDGLLSGTPSQAQDFNFTVKVTSGGVDETKAYTLKVHPKDLPLSIIDQVLPMAEFGRSYEYQLVAVGGVAPYTWSLRNNLGLPPGLALSRDGFIEGRTADSRDVPYAFTVEVTDKNGSQAARQLEIRVVEPSSLSIALVRLPTAYLEKQYSVELRAVGGSGDYNWSVAKFQRLAQTPTESAGEAVGGIPEGFGLSLVKQGTQMRLTGKPLQAGLYAVTLSVTDAQVPDGPIDVTTLPLLVSYTEPLSIVTTVLPDAFVGKPYSVSLTHVGSESKEVKYATACVQQATSGPNGFTYSCVTPDPLQQLPPGIILSEDGKLSGLPQAVPDSVPAVTDPDTGEPMPRSIVYSFLVQATDEKGRTDVRSLSIKVREPRPETGGCSGTGIGPVAMALFALAGLLRRRR